MKKNTRVIQSKRNILLVVVIIVASLVVAMGITIYILHDKQKLDILRQDLQSTHASLGKIASDLGQQTQTIWNDQSECYQTAPRLFGDDYKYSCDVVYSIASKKVVPLREFDRVRGSVTINGRAVVFSKSVVNDHVSYTSQLDSDERTDNCSLRYEYNLQNQVLNGTLACYFSLTKAQYDAVSSTLKTGEDRT